MEYRTIACFTIAAMSLVPNWWNEFIFPKLKANGNLSPNGLCETICQNISLVYKGKSFPWQVSRSLTLNSPNASDHYWDYLNFLDTVVVADIDPDTNFDDYFREFKVEKTERKVKSENFVVPGYSDSSTPKQKVKTYLKAAAEDTEATTLFVQNFIPVFRKWDPSYENLYSSERFLLDVFSLLLNLGAEKKYSLHVGLRLSSSCYFPTEGRISRGKPELPDPQELQRRVKETTMKFFPYFDKYSSYL